MQYVALYFGVTLVGYLIGWSMRRKGRKKSPLIGTLQGAAVAVLIFVMSARIGANKQVLLNLDQIGWSALLTAVFALGGSVLFVHVIRRVMGIDSKGERRID